MDFHNLYNIIFDEHFDIPVRERPNDQLTVIVKVIKYLKSLLNTNLPINNSLCSLTIFKSHNYLFNSVVLQSKHKCIYYVTIEPWRLSARGFHIHIRRFLIKSTAVVKSIKKTWIKNKKENSLKSFDSNFGANWFY